MTTSHGDGDQEIYGDYSVDDEDQPGNIDDLGDGDTVDELDRGYSPPEKWSAAQGYGNTPWEEEHRETIDQRIAEGQRGGWTDHKKFAMASIGVATVGYLMMYIWKD